jgi:hypothetical protein
MSTSSRLLGYAALISAAIDVEDAATVKLVERFMRTETGGVLDHLSASAFARLARQAYDDAIAWNEIGVINGVTLADVCRVEQIDLPAWVTTATGGAQA